MNKNQSSQIIIYNTEDGKSQVNLTDATDGKNYNDAMDDERLKDPR
jgi:hypothetical protein